MGYKDTIIDDGEKLACSLISKYPFKDVKDVIDEACIHQAETTFPLAKQEGIKLVVEWIESNHTLVEKRLDWIAQKKEWGIK